MYFDKKLNIFSCEMYCMYVFLCKNCGDRSQHRQEECGTVHKYTLNLIYTIIIISIFLIFNNCVTFQQISNNENSNIYLYRFHSVEYQCSVAISTHIPDIFMAFASSVILRKTWTN